MLICFAHASHLIVQPTSKILLQAHWEGECSQFQNIDDEDIENLLIQQIEFCNTIIINKVDDISKEELKKVEAVIKALQPNAKIIETNYAKVDVKEILNTNLFDFYKASTSAAWIQELENDEDGGNLEEGEKEEYGIENFVYRRRIPFNRKKFEELVNFKWQKNIIRSKGILWFADENDMSYVFEQAGRQMQLRKTGQWVDSLNEIEKQEVIENEPDVLKEWDKDVGDRIIKIVFIGRDMKKEQIIKELDECLD